MRGLFQYMSTLQKSLCEANIDHGPLNYETMSSHFVQLMTGVEKNLHMKTRDRWVIIQFYVIMLFFVIEHMILWL